MKSKGPELGNLSSRFFAYVQLKRLDVVRTGEIAPILDISASQERDLFRRLSDSGWILRLKRGLYLVPPRIPAGGKYSPGAALILQKLMDEEKGRYQICGPTAFNFYRLDDQIPSVTYLYNNRISGKRSIGSLAFQFIKVADERLGAVNAVSTLEDMKTIYSSKSRTLMDAVYDWSRFNSLPRGYDWIKGEIKNEPSLASEIIKNTAKYGNMATTRRIGYLLDILVRNSRTMNRLHRQLSTSNSLIPWIPGRSAKGTINRKWGIIVNG
ncbi:MAG: type IV toxin-antitoxin system AbiEi family antitoxin domain-containing protein [Deltaproteobacteria bacterium]|nr:type IV toxin-antitoxin system AbiEi family antitoxin domain-containing protein [Deltaproteobacteria bacterium]